MSATTPNNLIHENSPYLQQHAYNPVNWYPWSTALLQTAQQQNKPLLISIGYAACHWCHVMEHECFEDTEVAQVMNEHFINIKIDREEHPDLDNTYMNALQLMQNGGGWPLNIIALPDGRPFWGATYVRKEDWIQVLQQLAGIYHNNNEKVTSYATKLQEGMKLFNIIEKPENTIINTALIEQSVTKWQQSWDMIYGGNAGAPKFMMPVQLDFLLHHFYHTQNSLTQQFVEKTLTKIAYGGIYDAIGGGFSRYSVDEKWHIPHFEKMLYDNAQLINTYCNAYKVFKDEVYLERVTESIQFITENLMDSKGAFFASLDADSLNNNNKKEEGAFYIWTKPELEQLLGEDFAIFSEVYNINALGHWEHNNYVLYQNDTITNIANKHNIPVTQLQETVAKCKSILHNSRESRPKPALDHKIITSWNALMITALVNAYVTLQSQDYLTLAINAATFIANYNTNSNGNLYRSYNPKKPIDACLEDYATLITAYLSIYEVTGNTTWLTEAKKLADITLDEFLDSNTNMFYFTPTHTPVIVQKSIEKADNVIPSSNSIMAHNLHKLGIYTSNSYYTKLYNTMQSTMVADALEYPRSYSNWLSLAEKELYPQYEVIIAGNNAQNIALVLKQHYLPNTIIAITTQPNNAPIFKNRYQPNQTLLYVCKNNSCHLPVTTVADAIAQIQAG